MTILEAKDITKIYNCTLTDKIHLEKEKAVLQGIDFNIDEGEFISIMGKSGCGKTTLLKILGTIDEATCGEVLYNGKSIKNYSDSVISQLRRKRIGFVFQDYNLFQNLSLEENIMVPMILEHMDVKKMQQIVKENAELLSISDILSKYPYEISGGEKQRVAIARALANDPSIILADEPTGNLDSASTKIVMDYMTDINKRRNKAIVIVTHDPFVASYASKVYFMKDGVMVDVIENSPNKEDNIQRVASRMLNL